MKQCEGFSLGLKDVASQASKDFPIHSLIIINDALAFLSPTLFTDLLLILG